MKRGRLPLKALRRFEGAGRHLSFGLAAEELLVCQTAISRQIRELETLLGTELLERLHRRVRLADAGRALLGELTTSFDAINRRLREVSGQTPANSVKITVEPAFAGAPGGCPARPVPGRVF
jgi:LysR family glycine cleavage system transcriptional activator